MSKIIKLPCLKSAFLLWCLCLLVNSISAQEYELVLVDSIKINSLEPLQITDYNFKTERFLVFGTATKSFLEVDRAGKVLSEVNYTGEGVGRFGRGVTELGYFGDQIIANGPNVYLVYNADWQYDYKMIYESGGAFLPLSYIPGAPEVVESAGVNKVIKSIDQNTFGNIKLEPGHFSEALMLEVTGREEGSKKYLNFPPNSIYNTSSDYYDAHQPVFSFNRSSKKLVLALPLESKLYYYNTNTWSLEKEVEIELTGFKKPKGLAYEDQHKNSLKGFGRSNEKNYIYSRQNSKVYSVSSFGEVNMIVHSTGFDERASVNTYQKALEELKAKGKTITSFWKGGKKLFETEQKFSRIVRTGEMEFISLVINEEEELDYSMYHVYKLRKLR